MLTVRASLLRLAAVVLVASAVGCSSADPEPTPEELASEQAERRLAGCQDLAEDIVASLQGYVDQFTPAVAGTIARSGASMEELAEAVTTFQQRRAGLGCGAREFPVQLEVAMEELEGEGPMARAVAAAIRDQVLATAGPAETVTVAPGEDLAAAVHGAGDRSIVRLQPGEHVLDEALVLLRPTTLVGVGPGRAVVRSSAPGAVLVYLGDGLFELDGVDVVYDGDAPASILVVSGGDVALHDVTVSGGVADDAATVGWGLVLGAAPGAAASTGGTISDLRAHGNEAGGVVVTGRAPVLRDVTSEGNGGCGVCYLQGGGGSLTGGRLTGNETGLSAAQDALAFASGLTVAGNRSAGVLVEGDARLELADSLVTGNGPAGLAVTGSGTLRAWGTVVTGHDDVAAIAEGSGRLLLGDVVLRTATVGLFVRGSSRAEVATLRIDDVAEAHAVYGEDATGRFGGTCQSQTFGVVLLERAEVVVDGDGCETVDQRDDG